MAKLGRQRAVLEIISGRAISTQFELANELRKLGYQVTQATVSRDIKELGLVKVPASGGAYCYALASGQQQLGEVNIRMQRLFRDSVVNMDSSENLILIRTLPGTAHAVASCIDGVRWPQVIGTVAGDDTLLVIVKSKRAVPQVMEKFRSLTT